MSALTCCNWRAGFFLLVLPAILMALVVPALGDSYWYDPAGVGEDFFGYAMTELEDLNGDGHDEFLVGVAGSDSTGLEAGQVFLWFGGASVLRAPDRIWNGTSPEAFGWAVANIGDVNDDGTADWAVGAPESNAGGSASGRVYVFYGDTDPPAMPDLVITGAQGGDKFGFAISAAGDFDGDGRDDFIVGAPFANLGVGNTGAAYVIYGQNGGPSSDLGDATAFSGEISDDHFGWSVTDAGNFFGGNERCVAVGAPLANTHGGIDAGAVYVFEGTLGGATADTTIDFVAGISANAKPNSQFGYAVRGVGRLNTDSVDDLAVGGPFCNEAGSESGRVEIFYGGASPNVVADHAIDGQSANDNFGWSLDRAGDISGSGRDDVLIGAPFYDGTATNGGRAYIYEGSSSATGAGSLEILANVPVNPGTAADDHYGWAVAAAGDFDGDGLPDYAVSAPNANIGSTNAQAGVVTLIHSTAGPVAAVMQTWQARWIGSDQVDLSFAFSVPSDELVALSLRRQTRDASGQLGGEEQLWSGPAERTDDGSANVLVRRGDGFGFRDATAAAGGSLITYAITAATADGQQVRLAELAGPGERPVAVTAPLALAAAWPNPANPAVTIRFRAAPDQIATLQIVDVRGRVVRELHRAPGAGQWQDVIWNGLTDDGRAAASGVYLIRLAAGQELRTERVVLAR